MPGFKELSESVSLAQQMESTEKGPIVLINLFTIEPADEDALIAAWKHDADFMKQQPGYISTQMHKGVGSSPTFINYAVWESVESFRNAFQNQNFKVESPNTHRVPSRLLTYSRRSQFLDTVWNSKKG